jgi:uncharacterized integral membrane protein (TIGR00697 family)
MDNTTIQFCFHHLLQIILCYGALIAWAKFFGKSGIYAYMVVGMIVGNIQVLTALDLINHVPVAFGTVVFASLYIATDLLTEYYGAAAARASVWLSFAGMLTFALLMAHTAHLPYVTDAVSVFSYNQRAIQQLFTPMPSIFIASFLAYIISQYIDIYIYNWLRERQRLGMGGRALVSTTFSGLCDNVIFSVLAWIVLAPQALEWDVVWKSYILGTWIMRVIMAVFGIPVMYFVRKTTDHALRSI